MEKFTNDIYGIFELINNNKDIKTIINITILSKQYLAYYLYRILVKFYNVFEIAISVADIKKLYLLLRIPEEHDRNKNYPLAGKMTNDEELLDLIILTEIDMFNKVDKYIQSLPNPDAYSNIYTFIKTKDLSIIIQDLIDLQKLIPGLSVSAIRPNYFDDQKLF
jgi:hypothetical protein